MDLDTAAVQILEAHYILTDEWWSEARIIALALFNETKPELCRHKPWSTYATYMMFDEDVIGQFNNANLTMPPKIQNVVGDIISELALSEGQESKGNNQHDKARRPTDDELCDRWQARHPEVTHGMGDWRRYNNGLWSTVDETTVEKQLLRVLVDAKPEGVNPTSGLLSSVSKFAQVRVFKPADTWDADPDLLVCENGMLHIPSKELRDHDREAYLTTGVPYAYEPDAECPTFIRALTRLPYRVTQFLQEYAGYCLTTDTQHEIAVWFLGLPGSGKSTIIEGFNAMLGDRAGVLSLKQVSQSRFGLSNIEGKTLIYAFETPSLYLETTDVLNALVSGERIIVERKFQDPVTIIPRAKVLWAMNKLPRIGDAGDGIFRRVQIVRFDALPGKDKDPLVKEKVKDEGPGILNWALLGLDRLRERGRFLIPPEIKATTEEFQEGNDPESAFVKECCKAEPLNPDLREQSSTLYNAYREWCITNGHKAKSSTSMADEWRRLGFERARITGRTYWRGVELLQNWG